LYTSSELENGLARAQRELKEAEARKTQLEREVDNSRMEKERALIDLDAARLQVQKKKENACFFFERER
jgi:predicted negative regulator of RcsB-dependent stress response